MDAELEGEVSELKTKAIIGFDGSIINGFIIHPDKKHVLYPIGNKITVQEWNTKKQTFLVGHTNIISTVAVSRSGKYVASGQINHIGFKARVIVWDFEKRELISHYEHHKVRVEAVVFSQDDRYVITLGGRDCGSLVVWDREVNQVVCGTQVSRGVQGEATVLKSMTKRGACFITGGDANCAVWIIDNKARNATSVNVCMYKLRRTILCLDVNERDEVSYLGTSTGDVLKVRLNFHHDPDILAPVKQPVCIGCYARLTKKKLPRGVVDLYQKGVRSIRLLFNGQIIIGAGDGTVELVEDVGIKIVDGDAVKLPSKPGLKPHKSTNVIGGVTTLRLMNDNTVIAATENSEIFIISMDDFRAKLIISCHVSTIYDIAFPHKFSEVFATAGKNDVRIWSMATMAELLRIRVQNFSCSSLVFSYDGTAILTGWSDGVIRSFTPLTGRLIYAIMNAHNKGVSALTTMSHGRNVITGGCEGQVRLWEVSPTRQQLVCTLKEHTGPVSAIHVNKFDNEAATASTDGTCIIWDLERQCRRQILFANTLFMCVKYYPTAVQIITGGSDRKLAYWEVLDGSLVRELEGSPSGTINTLDISPDGQRFVSGGNDQVVKVWKYQEGITTHVGTGHAAVVTASTFSADGKVIITCDASGCVFVWECPTDPPAEKAPEDTAEKKVDAPAPETPKGEENIRDLPSVRSDKSQASVKDDICCKCPSESSGDSVCGSTRERVCAEPVKSPSSRSVCSEKSNKSVKASPKSRTSVRDSPKSQKSDIICSPKPKSEKNIQVAEPKR